VSVLLMCLHTSTAAAASFTATNITATAATTSINTTVIITIIIIIIIIIIIVVVVVVVQGSAVGSNPGGGDLFHTQSDSPWGPPKILYYGYWALPRDKAARAWRCQPTPFSDEVKGRV